MQTSEHPYTYTNPNNAYINHQANQAWADQNGQMPTIPCTNPHYGDPAELANGEWWATKLIESSKNDLI